MNKKLLTTIELVLQGLSFLMLFVAKNYVAVASKSGSGQIIDLGTDTFVSVVGRYEDGDLFMVLICIAACLAAFVIVALQLVKEPKYTGKKQTLAAPAAALLLFLAGSIYRTSRLQSWNYNGSWKQREFTLAWGFYLTLLLLVLVLLIDIIRKYSGASAEVKIAKVSTESGITNSPKGSEKQPDTMISQADELLKFKNLLDQGIITEAEFKAKKDEILGIKGIESTNQK